jgi:hypothetical protein
VLQIEVITIKAKAALRAGTMTINREYSTAES